MFDVLSSSDIATSPPPVRKEIEAKQRAHMPKDGDSQETPTTFRARGAQWPDALIVIRAPVDVLYGRAERFHLASPYLKPHAIPKCGLPA